MRRHTLISSLIIIVLMSVSLIGCSILPKQPTEPPAEQTTPPATPPDNNGSETTGQPGENQENPALKLNVYFPLTKGSTWQYEGEGNEYATFNREVLFTKDTLAQVKEDNGGTVSASIFKVTDNTITRIFFKGEVYEAINLLESKPNDNTIILKTPLVVGTKWGNNNEVREIVNLNETTTTPAGKFEKCVKVKITSQNSTSYEYFKDGVGMVKREFTSEGSQISSSLKTYNIKK